MLCLCASMTTKSAFECSARRTMASVTEKSATAVQVTAMPARRGRAAAFSSSFRRASTQARVICASSTRVIPKTGGTGRTTLNSSM